MGPIVHRLFSALLIFTVFSMAMGCCEFSDLSNKLENLGQASYSDTLGKIQTDLKQASYLAEKNTGPDTDCQGADGCLQCRTGCCHLLIPILSNLTSLSMDADGFEEIPLAAYLSRVLSGPEEPPKA